MDASLTSHVGPLVELIRSQPGMAERLLAEHTDDGWGRCRTCSNGGQTGRPRWPCAIHRCAVRAAAAADPAHPPAGRRRPDRDEPNPGRPR
jgi:hypothetical protein